MAAAANPIDQPRRDFLAIDAADIQRFRVGCKGCVVAAFRYRAQQFGTTFRTSRAEIRRWCKGGYSLNAIDYVLAQLRAEKFISTRSDGRGFFVSMLEMQQNIKLVSQSSKVKNSALIDRARVLEERRIQKTETTTTRPAPIEVPAPVVVPPESPIIATIAEEAGPIVASLAKTLPAEKVEEAVAAAQEYRADLKRRGENSSAAKVFSKALREGWRPNKPCRKVAADLSPRGPQLGPNVPNSEGDKSSPRPICGLCRAPLAASDEYACAACMARCADEEREAIAAEGKSLSTTVDKVGPPSKGQPNTWTRQKYQEWVNSHVGPSTPQGPPKPGSTGNIPRAASIIEEMEVLQRALRGPAWRDECDAYWDSQKGGKPWKA